ncbi:transient receptor potential cation channel protein painless [Topomyia yanbarensis]|uniref:transient receptor potential cation channel protein painless n=1 Tax=Topomyia yanbarensis TaxID=2498891 RepID=UPI00273B4FF7|nr:transient receptor potential cation channel protein painless [Topomyia yanbarensis]XP_058829466.1 transient receptor potential cation channel protein painless [Topomyia yanbarensis]XP_058829467.1 transient receptor potential cation channel protein painless [Topomyia yanbarensis]XP_058829469.1 transient receptor potential cation channel protein painless [Topomyia yanbarensis]
MESKLTVLMALMKSQNEAKFFTALEQFRYNQTDANEWQRDLRALMDVAVQSGKLSLVKKIANDDYVFDAESDLSAHLARCCSYGYHELLAFILSKTGHSDGDIQAINSFTLISLVIKEINTLKDSRKCPFFKCLYILLDDDRVDIDKTDEQGFSALHYAVKYKVDEAVELLLKHSAYIGVKNVFRELPICEMNPQILEDYLNTCITANDKRPGDEAYEVNIDFSCLVPPKCKSLYSAIRNDNTARRDHDEMLPIVYMSHSDDLRYLLKHPVISSFVLIKWLRLSLYFYINLVICTVSFLAFTSYVVGCYGQENVDQMIKETLRFTSLLGTTYMALREIGQMFLHVKMYFSSIENWMEIVLIVASYTVLLNEFPSEIRQVLSAGVIMLSAMEFTMLVGTLPILSISTHMVMLKTVSKNFLKSLILYSIILISFAFCFYTLFKVNNSTGPKNAYSPPNDDDKQEEDKFNAFGDVGTSLLKTVVMLTGEFEAADIKFRNSVSYLIFVLFLFFVTLVIFNLMNGLAVSDTVAIKAAAELIGLSQKVDVISRYECALQSPKVNGMLTKLMMLTFSRTFLQLFPEYLPLHRVTVTPNRSNAIFIPRPLKHIDPETAKIDMESNIELLAEGDTSNERVKLIVGCCILPSFSKMDSKIMKYAKEILHTRNKRNHQGVPDRPQQSVDARLAKLESNMELILQCLNNNGWTK